MLTEYYQGSYLYWVASLAQFDRTTGKVLLANRDGGNAYHSYSITSAPSLKMVLSTTDVIYTTLSEYYYTGYLITHIFMTSPTTLV